MNDTRLAELNKKYKKRNLLEELAWGVYANHSGYTSKSNGEFLNCLCLSAYKKLRAIQNVIDTPNTVIQEDAIKYKMIKEIIEKEVQE